MFGNLSRLCVITLCVYCLGTAAGILSSQDCASANFLFQSNFTSNEGTATLIKGLDSFNPKERRNAALSLQKLSQRNSRQELILSSESSELQRIIPRCKELDMAIDALANTSDDIDVRVREASVAALCEIGKENLLLLDSVLFQSGKNKHISDILEKQKTTLIIQLTKSTRDQERRVASAADKAIHLIKRNTKKKQELTTLDLVEFENKSDGLKSEPSISETSSPTSRDAGEPAGFVNTESKGNPIPYSISGYAESENYRGMSSHYSDSAGTDKTSPRKAEVHAKLNMAFETESVMLKSIVHGYGYMPGSNITDPGYENRVYIPELYVSYITPEFDIQAGRQIIKWGTADTLNPTSYFCPYDLTENFLKEDDELFLGVYALNGKILFNDYSLQAIISPVHTPAKLPSNDSPWQLTFPPVNLGAMVLPNRGVQSAQKLDTSLDNTGCGLRFTGTKYGMDFSFSYYRGPDKDVILKPELVMDMTNPANAHIVMVPQYDIISTVGGDVAFTVSNITFQAEATWTKDKPAVTDYTQTGGRTFMEKTGFLFWDAGGTWISDNNCTVILEYIDGFYTNNHNRYLSPLLSKLISGTLTKKFLNDHLTVEVKGLYNTSQKDSLLIPSIEWDFQNGFHMKLAGGIFSGQSDTLFGSYNDRDILNLTLRYYF